jgi:hypothetical protein
MSKKAARNDDENLTIECVRNVCVCERERERDFKWIIESASLPTLKDPSKFNPKKYFHEVWFLIFPSSMETPQYFFYKNQWLALYGWLKMA